VLSQGGTTYYECDTCVYEGFYVPLCLAPPRNCFVGDAPGLTKVTEDGKTQMLSCFELWHQLPAVTALRDCIVARIRAIAGAKRSGLEHAAAPPGSTGPSSSSSAPSVPGTGEQSSSPETARNLDQELAQASVEE
jgi:hypothetical protein